MIFLASHLRFRGGGSHERICQKSLENIPGPRMLADTIEHGQAGQPPKSQVEKIRPQNMSCPAVMPESQSGTVYVSSLCIHPWLR